MMPSVFASVVSVIVIVASSAALAEEKCPAASLQSDDIVKAIQAAASCKAAYDVMNACRVGAGGDVELANVVSEKCEATFMARLAAGQKRAYERERAACRRKYAKKEGTLYVSLAVSCEAGVSVRYARRYGKAPR
jgi:hypothetical protein